VRSRRVGGRGVAPCVVGLVMTALAACGGAESSTDAQPARSARLLSTGPSLQATAAAVDARSLFDWAEYTYPALFPKGAQNQPLRYEGVDYIIRAYPNGNHLGLTAGGDVYGLGPFTGNVLTAFGKAADYAAQIAADACKVDPASCSAGLTLAAGFDITLALRADGSVLQGANALPWTQAPATDLAGSSLRVLTGPQAASLDLDRVYALAVGRDGLLYGWGVNNGGQLGGDEGNGPVPAPRALGGVAGVQQGLATSVYALALRDDGSVWHWPGTLTTSGGRAVSVPRAVEGLGGVAALTALGSSVDGSRQRPAAILSDGTVRELSWAPRVAFANGNPVTTHTGTATAIAGLSDIRRISCKLYRAAWL
jgi:hypothetical protein